MGIWRQTPRIHLRSNKKKNWPQIEFANGPPVKNLPAMQETWVPSLGREDPLEEGMATHSSILAWRIPMDRGA